MTFGSVLAQCVVVIRSLSDQSKNLRVVFNRFIESVVVCYGNRSVSCQFKISMKNKFGSQPSSMLKVVDN